MSSVHSPQKKKRLAYERDHYAKGRNDKAFRKGWPTKKRKASHAFRHAANALTKTAALDEESDARINVLKKHLLKEPVSKLGEIVPAKLAKRAWRASSEKGFTMPPVQNHEPSADSLRSACEAYKVHLLSFDRDLVKLEPKDFLPGYNRLRFTIRCRAPYTERPLFLTVRRHGSKLGAENFYTVPFFAGEISVGAEAEYELLSFDTFAVPFASISVEMCRFEDYLKRRISGEHIKRAKKFSTEIPRKNC